jgi:hypothetical protein
MILFQRPIYSAPVGTITFPNVYNAINPPPLRWLLTDLWMTAIPGSRLNVLELESKVTQSDEPGLWVTHGHMLEIVRWCDQMIDGEFLGHLTTGNPEAFAPVVRIDFFDSTTATVVIDETIINPSKELAILLGSGVAQSHMMTRDTLI